MARTKREQTFLEKALGRHKSMCVVSDIEHELVYPTLTPSVNRATGIGGIPSKRFIMSHGKNQTGKSVLAMAMAESMRLHGFTPFIFDTEFGAENEWYNTIMSGGECGFDQPDTYEDFCEKINGLFKLFGEGYKKSDPGLCIVVDTITELMPKDMMEKMLKEGPNKAYAIQAMFNGQIVRTYKGLLNRYNSMMILVTQEIENQDRANSYSPEHKPKGGQAIQYYSSYRIHTKAPKKIRVNDRIVGMMNTFTVEKNKCSGSDFATGCFHTSNGDGDVPIGLDISRDVIWELKHTKFGEKKGSQVLISDMNLSFDGTWEDFRIHLNEDVEMRNRIVEFMANRFRKENSGG